LLTRKDNRLIAAEWVNNNLPEGSSVSQSVRFGTYGLIMINPPLESLRQEFRIAVSGKKQLEEKYLRSKIDYIRANNLRGFNEFAYDRILRRFISKNGQNTILSPDYIIVEESPLEYYSLISKEPIKLLHKDYYLLKEFKAIDINNRSNWFDQQDAFYVPFAGFQGISRPGPNIFIYAKKAKPRVPAQE
jgi:hypothetical protein